jgi:FtsZ-interacting cell division protein ZipA
MDTWVWILIAIVVIVIIAIAAWTMTRKRRTERLQGRFGPEYDRTVEESDGRRAAERELTERERRRAELDIRPLTPAARDRYVEEWRLVQQRFVDDPSSAIGQADSLVTQVMRDRGYPTDDFEQRAADVSVDHPNVVTNYREAHDISQRNDQGGVSTEHLRQAMVHYRALFEDLLETGGDTANAEENTGPAPGQRLRRDSEIGTPR